MTITRFLATTLGALTISAMTATAAIAGGLGGASSSGFTYNRISYTRPVYTVPYVLPIIDPDGGLQTGGDTTYRIADELNRLRAAKGLPKVRVTRSLESAAIACSVSNMKRIVKSGPSLSHGLPGCGYENLFWSSRNTPMPTPSSVMGAWEKSVGHYRAMMDRRVTEVSVGWAAVPGHGVVIAMAMEF